MLEYVRKWRFEFMKKIIPNGTNVLIFNKTDSQEKNDETKFIKGVIINSWKADDLVYQEISWNGQIYEVQGEDGKIYKVTYGNAIIGDFYIKTLVDYLKHVRSLMENNREKIDDLNTKNAIFTNLLLSLTNDKKVEKDKDSTRSGYGNDSDDIAERIKGFEYRPEDKESILEYYQKKSLFPNYSGYTPGDADDIAERMNGFKYRPENKEKILKYYK